MTVVAAIRMDDGVNIALFVHVLGAMVLVGSLVVVVATLVRAWRRADPVASAALTRLGLRTLLVVTLPAYIVMRIGAQWTESEEKLGDFELTWLDIGYLIADGGAVLMLISIVLALVALRRERSMALLARIVASVSVVLLAAYVVAVWAMTTKPD